MRIKSKFKTLKSLLRVKLFNGRVPLAVRWQLTNRCILKCKYCNVWDTPQKEPSLKEISDILDELAKLGTQTISFSGGEPMLREDIAEILKQAKQRNISTEMNSTGALIPKNIEKLKHLDFLKISLDGPEDIHDSIRGNGSFKMAIEGAIAAKNNKLNFIFTTTLTNQSIGIDCIDFILETAKRFNTFVAVQPLKVIYRGVKDISRLSPSRDDYQKTIKKLIDFKKKNNRYLRNSLIGLYHIYDWPHYKKLKCWAGKVFCIINTDGTVLPCDRISYVPHLPNCLEKGFTQAFLNLPEVNCSGCGFCGVLELNFLMAFKLGTIESILKIIR